MKRFFLFIFLLSVLESAPGAAAQVQPGSPISPSTPARTPRLWLSAGLEGSENGFEAVGELSFRFDHAPVVLSVQHARQLPDFIGTTDTPLEAYHMTNVLASVVASNRVAAARLSAGVGYMTGIEHVGWSADKLVDGFLSRTGNFPEQAFSHVNLPLRADLLVTPSGVFGGGVFVQANVNPTRSFVSAGLQFALGNLR